MKTTDARGFWPTLGWHIARFLLIIAGLQFVLWLLAMLLDAIT